MKPRHLIVPATVLALAGCVTHKVDPELPSTPQPDAWIDAPASTEERIAAEELAIWWTQFEDDQLTRLVQRCLDENLDLQAAFARVKEAIALRGVAAGEYWPQINGSGSVLGAQLSDAEGGATAPDRNPTLYNLGLDLSWELDLWGRIAKSVQAADADTQASIEDLRGLRASIAAQSAASYLSLRELQLRQKFLEENIARQEETLTLTQGRLDAGLVPALDVEQAKLNLAQTKAGLPTLRQQQIATLRGLELLAGLAPGELEKLWEDFRAPPLPEPNNLNDIPANVIRRRPDIRQTEQRLIGAAARLGVAQADIYPRLSISGSFAWSSSDSGSLFDGNSQSFRLGPVLTFPIFQGGRLKANVEANKARLEQAELAYRQQVLFSLQEVETAFNAYREERVRLDMLNEGVRAAQTAVTQVRALYENGLVTFLNVLDAERNLAAQQDNAAASLGQCGRNLVDVYRSLGGGWDAPEFEEPEIIAMEEAAPVEPPPPPVKTALSDQEAILALTRRDEDTLILHVEELVAYQRKAEDAPRIRESILLPLSAVNKEETLEKLEMLRPGERIRVSWEENRITQGDEVRTEITVNELEVISKPAP